MVIGMIVLGVFVVRPLLQNRTVMTVVTEVVDRPALNISFSFPSGESAYSFIEPPIEEGATTGLEAAFILLKTDAYMEFQQSTPGGEAPPSITFFILKEPAESTSTVASGTVRVDRLTKLRTWAQSNNTLTMIDRAKSAPEVVDLDGVNALHYQTDGLYLQDVYLAFYKNKYYMFVGQYDGETDPARAVFDEVVRSIIFL